MPVDLQALTTIQQNNLTPQPPPARGPITLTVCVTPHLSTTSRQHYFHRTAPLYMERRIYFRSPRRRLLGGAGLEFGAVYRPRGTGGCVRRHVCSCGSRSLSRSWPESLAQS